MPQKTCGGGFSHVMVFAFLFLPKKCTPKLNRNAQVFMLETF